MHGLWPFPQPHMGDAPNTILQKGLKMRTTMLQDMHVADLRIVFKACVLFAIYTVSKTSKCPSWVIDSIALKFVFSPPLIRKYFVGCARPAQTGFWEQVENVEEAVSDTNSALLRL